MPPQICAVQLLCLLLWPRSAFSKTRTRHGVGKVRNLRASHDVGGAMCGTSHRAGRDVGAAEWSAQEFGAVTLFGVGCGDSEWSEVKCGGVVCSGVRIGAVEWRDSERSAVRSGGVANGPFPGDRAGCHN